MLLVCCPPVFFFSVSERNLEDIGLLENIQSFTNAEMHS